ncbi:hypothetical protein ACGFYZ_22640 [Streptomyces sp. NPDC048330]|uniref:hypothetical protein n=1 Tax=Streptomyces sp. NPDC048330 TaxID=3365533 RepID=UPI003720C7C7
MLSRRTTHDISISDRRPAREAAEAALVENYSGLVRLAYLILPPALGRHRRVLTAHTLVQRALPAAARRSGPEASGAGTPHPVPPGAGSPDAPETGSPPAPSVPGQRGGERPAHSRLRATVVAAALHPTRRYAALVPLPLVLGLRLFPRAGGSEELALDRALAGTSPEVRAALALRTLEHLTEDAVVRLLASAGVAEPSAALRGANLIVADSGADVERLLRSAEFDPCTVQTRPTDLLRRSRHGRLAALAGALLLAATATVATGGLRSAPDPGPAGPVGSVSVAGSAPSLDPAALVRAPADRWADTARVDFTAWPARGPRTGDTALLGRALIAWGRGADGGARVTATPGTPTSPPADPPRLLFAGTVDDAAVVLLHDGRRLARYAEPRDGRGPVVLDLARADDADVTTGAAVVVGRTGAGTRFLLAPWIAGAGTRDLGSPGTAAGPLAVDPDGVTAPVPYDGAPAAAAACPRTTALQLRSSTRIVEDHAFLLADLGELTPVHLTWTPPPGTGAPARAPREATGARGLAAWARSACSLAGLHGAGVRAVNRWEYAEQALPERAGRAVWVCTRADTWEGGGRVALSFEVPAWRRVAEVRDTAACSRFGQHVLAGGYWTAPSGTRYFLAAGSRHVTGVTAGGAVSATGRGPVLAAAAGAEGPVRLTGRLTDGSDLSGLTAGQDPAAGAGAMAGDRAAAGGGGPAADGGPGRPGRPSPPAVGGG